MEELASDQNIRYINFAHTIDEKQANFLMQNCSESFFMDKSHILYLIISSTGGSVDHGITLYNFFRALPCIVYTHNIGTIDSVANIVFLAGDIRYAAPSARFFIHGVFWAPPGNQFFPLAQVNEYYSRLEYDAGRIRNILRERTLLTDERISELYLSGESLSPESAKEVGIVSEIADLMIQEGCALFTSNPA